MFHDGDLFADAEVVHVAVVPEEGNFFKGELEGVAGGFAPEGFGLVGPPGGALGPGEGEAGLVFGVVMGVFEHGFGGHAEVFDAEGIAGGAGMVAHVEVESAVGGEEDELALGAGVVEGGGQEGKGEGDEKDEDGEEVASGAGDELVDHPGGGDGQHAGEAEGDESGEGTESGGAAEGEEGGGGGEKGEEGEAEGIEGVGHGEGGIDDGEGVGGVDEAGENGPGG